MKWPLFVASLGNLQRLETVGVNGWHQLMCLVAETVCDWYAFHFSFGIIVSKVCCTWFFYSCNHFVTVISSQIMFYAKKKMSELSNSWLQKASIIICWSNVQFCNKAFYSTCLITLLFKVMLNVELPSDTSFQQGNVFLHFPFGSCYHLLYINKM